MFHCVDCLLLPNFFCQIPISPSRIGQIFEQPKSKSEVNPPRSMTICNTLYYSEILSPSANDIRLGHKMRYPQYQINLEFLTGVVNFHKSKNPNELLNDWSHDISELMGLVQKTTHLINKEEMVHKHMRVGGADDK